MEKKTMTSIKEIIYTLLNEIKSVLRDYMNETEVALKKRLKKILLVGIITSILTALVASFLGSASLFILIGSLRYLELSMPAWKAWYIVGISSGIIGVIIILMLYIIIRRQLKTDKKS